MTNFKIYYRFGFILYKAIAKDNIKKTKGKLIYKRKLPKGNLGLNKNDIFKMIKDDISKLINERINCFHKNQIAFIFEENIRKVLQIEFNWSQSQIPRDFYYREIKVKNSPYSSIIWKNNHKKISNKNGTEFYITFNEDDKSCEIFLKNSDKPYYKIKNYSYELIQEIFGKNLVFYPTKRLEIDGLFEVSKFHFPYFHDNEAKLIYKNFDDKDIENFAYIIVEIK